MSQCTPVSRKKLQFGVDGSKKSASPNNQIGSYIFLKCHVSDTSHPNITEIAMVSLTEHDLEHSGSGDTGIKHMESESSPRYKDVLVLSFDPNEALHAQDAVNSDLTLPVLKQSKKLPFSQASVKLIDEFLRVQQSPVCIISHSGNYLDFRFLKTAVSRLGMNLLDGNLMCVDTVDMFSKIDSDQNAACLLDSKRYSLDNVYRRFFGELPCTFQYDAKSLVMRLIEVYKTVLHNSGSAEMKYFNRIRIPISLASSTQGSPNLSSPMKKIILDLEANSEDNSCTVNENDSTIASQQICDAKPKATDSVETFVFIDLETTGLDTDTDNIIEICACAVNVQDLAYFDTAGNEVDLKKIIPRLVDQINLMVLPLCDISVAAAEIHGIKREELLLRNKQCFTINTARLMENFFLQLKEPICLVAHNGFKFDYPMLLSHLNRTKTDHSIWSRIYCTDSLIVLREQFPNQSHRLTYVYNTLARQVKGSICQSHSAEGDVLRLMVITRLQKQMVEWLECKKIRFNELKKACGSGDQSSQNVVHAP